MHSVPEARRKKKFSSYVIHAVSPKLKITIFLLSEVCEELAHDESCMKKGILQKGRALIMDFLRAGSGLGMVTHWV